MKPCNLGWHGKRPACRSALVGAAVVLASAFGASRAEAHINFRVTSNLDDRTLFVTKIDDFSVRRVNPALAVYFSAPEAGREPELDLPPKPARDDAGRHSARNVRRRD